jgi:hypothetical protein
MQKVKMETAKLAAEMSFWVNRREDYIIDREAKGLPVSKIDIAIPYVNIDANQPWALEWVDCCTL